LRIALFNWRSVLSSNAGGAEVHLYEIFNRIAEKNQVYLIASCNNMRVTKNELTIGNLHVFHITRKELLYPLFSLRLLPRVLTRKFDIIIEDDSKVPIIWPLIMSRLLSMPFVLIIHHVHGKTLFEEFPSTVAYVVYLYELTMLKLYAHFNPYVVTVSESTKKELKTLGFQEDKISIVYNAVSKPSSEPGRVKSSDPLVVYVGRVKTYKRLEHLVQAIKNVPQARLAIAGKGDKKVYANLVVLVRELGLESRVKLIGEVTEEEKRSILQEAWVYVATSMKEGFGICVLEAQAYGVPVVAYNVHGLSESVKNGCSGLLVSDCDIDGLSKAISVLLQDQALRERLSRGAVEYSGYFNWTRSAREFLHLIDQITRQNLPKHVRSEQANS